MSTDTDVLQLCTFRIGALACAVDVRAVQEVLRGQELTPVPLAPPHVAGLLNLRGHIVAAVDLAPTLSQPPTRERAMNVVVSHDGELVSLLVDSIGEVIDVAPSQWMSPPLTMPASERAVVCAVYRRDDDLVLVLDAACAFVVGRDVDASGAVGATA